MNSKFELTLENPSNPDKEYEFEWLTGKKDKVQLKNVQYQKFIIGHTDRSLAVDGNDRGNNFSQKVWHRSDPDESSSGSQRIVSLYIKTNELGNKKYYFYYNEEIEKFQLKEYDTTADIELAN